MTSRQKRLVQSSFEEIEAVADDAGTLIFSRMFVLDPSLRRLFRSGPREQARKVMPVVSIAIKALNHIDPLLPVIEDLGRDYAGYSVTEGQYETAGEALMWALESVLGDKFTPETRDAWAAAYRMFAAVVRHGAEAQVRAAASWTPGVPSGSDYCRSKGSAPMVPINSSR